MTRLACACVCGQTSLAPSGHRVSCFRSCQLLQWFWQKTEQQLSVWPQNSEGTKKKKSWGLKEIRCTEAEMGSGHIAYINTESDGFPLWGNLRAGHVLGVRFVTLFQRQEIWTQLASKTHQVHRWYSSVRGYIQRLLYFSFNCSFHAPAVYAQHLPHYIDLAIMWKHLKGIK